MSDSLFYTIIRLKMTTVILAKIAQAIVNSTFKNTINNIDLTNSAQKIRVQKSQRQFGKVKGIHSDRKVTLGLYE